MFNFDFLEKGLGIISLLHFVYDFSKKKNVKKNISRLKLTVQIQLALHSCHPFLINNRNMTGNIVEK